MHYYNKEWLGGETVYNKEWLGGETVLASQAYRYNKNITMGI